MPFQKRTLILSVILGAAVAGEPVKLDSKFDIEEVRFVKQTGTSTVSGKASLKLADGTFKDCAGFNIELLPVAAYSKERIVRTYGNDQHGQILMEQNPPKFTPDAPEYHDMLIKGACDLRGEFSFSNVPAGDYFVMAFIIWDDASGPTPRKTGGAVMKRIRVSAGSQIEVLL
ncbi:MAG: hypothetical protein H7Y89_03335 [Steroidobacteraceae bacterium]|nr:hypothetical protein [Steroidobacteraceae bacterium]